MLDGKLDEVDWEKANEISDFFKREPRQGGNIRYKTKVKFLYDEKYLYVGAWCKDSVGIKGIRVQDLRRDFSWGENDLFGIALDPQNLKQYAQAFQTTPMGINETFRTLMGIPLIRVGIPCGRLEQSEITTATLLKWLFLLKRCGMTLHKRENQ